MKHMIQGRANALHVVCGSLFLVCALTHTLFAGTLSDAVPPQFTEDYRSYSSGAVIVRFDVKALERRSSLPGPRSMHARILAAANDIIPGVTLRRDLTGVMDGLVALHLPMGMGVQAAVKRLNQCDDVVYAEPCYKFRLAGTIPNDPSFGIQWGLNTDINPGQLDIDINAPEAWD